MHSARLFVFRILLVFVSMTLSTMISARPAFARPEYAVENTIVNCTACHVSPVGGGIRTLAGKQFGFHGREAGKTAPQELFQIDSRSILLIQEQYKESREGLGLMEVLAALDYPIEKSDDQTSGDQTSDVRFVASYNFGTFIEGLRDAYIRWHRPAEGIAPEDALFGLFQAPFGLYSDEHRTYVRVQTRTTHNDFYMGVLGARDFFHSLHLDLALSNGFQNSSDEGSGRFSVGPTAGLFGNARWIPPRDSFFHGFLLGTSGRYNSRHDGKTDPYAFSLYGAYSLGQATNGRFNVTLLAEASLAKHWNDSAINPEMGRLFLPSSDPAFTNDVKEASSFGALAQLNLTISPYWILLYKFDRIDLSLDRSDDTFTRHGFGFRHFVSRYFVLQARYEFAQTTVKDLPKENIAGQDAFWALFHFWF